MCTMPGSGHGSQEEASVQLCMCLFVNTTRTLLLAEHGNRQGYSVIAFLCRASGAKPADGGKCWAEPTFVGLDRRDVQSATD